MAAVEWALLCERVETDERGYLNAVHIVGAVAADLPVRVNMALVFRIVGQPHATVSFEVTVESPDGVLLRCPHRQEQAVGTCGLLDGCVHLRELPIEQYGDYIIGILLDSAPSRTVRLPVVPLPQSVH